MRRIATAARKLPQTLRAHWLVAVAAAVLVAAPSVYVFGQNHTQLPEGGLGQTQHAPTRLAQLPDTTPAPVASAQSIAASSCSQNGTGKLIIVSISQQHMWACDGSSLAKDSAVTTGASALTNVDDATPTGTWRIYSKQTNTTLKGCDVNGCWNDPVAYWMPFDDQVGFHDASWQTFPFGSSLYTTQGSHACVHLPTDVAAWVYGWAPVGTTVTVEA